MYSISKVLLVGTPAVCAIQSSRGRLYAPAAPPKRQLRSFDASQYGPSKQSGSLRKRTPSRRDKFEDKHRDQGKPHASNEAMTDPKFSSLDISKSAKRATDLQKIKARVGTNRDIKLPEIAKDETFPLVRFEKTTLEDVQNFPNLGPLPGDSLGPLPGDSLSSKVRRRSQKEKWMQDQKEARDAQIKAANAQEEKSELRRQSSAEEEKIAKQKSVLKNMRRKGKRANDRVGVSVADMDKVNNMVNKYSAQPNARTKSFLPDHTNKGNTSQGLRM